MEYEILKFNVSDNIITVTISRPKSMNALNSKFFYEMDALISEISARDDLKVMILTGDGKAFVAGADVAEMVNMTQTQGSEFSRFGQKVFRNMELLEIPVIGAINGFALGGGCELAMACDIRIASSKAKFGQPEVNLGITPGYAGTQRLPNLTGIGNALLLLLTGDIISADEALRIGLVQKIVEPDDLINTTRELALKIASKGPKAVRYAKQLARRSMHVDLDIGSSMEAERFGSLLENEGAEGMKAFLEKRKPNW